jgi:dGTPase
LIQDDCEHGLAELASFASQAAQATRQFNETESPIRQQRSGHRSEFQRDRDRIIHSAAFRRLEYKTQVFVNHEGDHYRTRLTHSLEVAQIARSIARHFALDEDLTEAIALAHDLGHTPFGHAGQEALNQCMHQHGGFEHNAQSLRVVDLLEQRYVAFDGLNLCFETREGILKHCSKTRARQLGEVGQRFLSGGQPSLEAQFANLADEIAYNNHDIEDGLRAGLLQPEQLTEVSLLSEVGKSIDLAYGSLPRRRWVAEMQRRLIDLMVSDLIAATSLGLERADPKSLGDVRGAKPLVSFSPEMHQQVGELKSFLRKELYRHPSVAEKMDEAQRVLQDLFVHLRNKPKDLPEEHYDRFTELGERALADYLAGMTDRFALREAKRLGIAYTRLAQG